MKFANVINVIRNEREYRMTRSLVRQFEHAVEQLDDLPGLSPEHRVAVATSYRRKLEELTREVSQYERLKNGQVPSMAMEDLASVGRALIAARIARRWTQADLARALGVKPQQVQKDESCDYASASLDRLAAVAAALGAEFDVRIAFAGVAQTRQSRPRRTSPKPRSVVQQAVPRR
ncbi:MAG: helix-turn-helix transcriptional regulator [Armatimonadetes bacterium]|nr:helix-turn-helix transcriptional regulator [Armatimonadota bacterium]